MLGCYALVLVPSLGVTALEACESAKLCWVAIWSLGDTDIELA